MRRGFELLKSRKLDDVLDVEALEKKYSIKLPPLYKVFMQTFDSPILHSEEYMKADGTLSYAATSLYEGVDGTESFTGFNKLEFVLSTKDEIEEWSKGAYLPIGDAFHGHGAVLVGTQSHEIDKILLHDHEFDNISIISNNIFEFVRSIKLEYKFYEDQVDHSKLYKNWGEDVWRIK